MALLKHALLPALLLLALAGYSEAILAKCSACQAVAVSLRPISACARPEGAPSGSRPARGASRALRRGNRSSSSSRGGYLHPQSLPSSGPVRDTFTLPRRRSTSCSCASTRRRRATTWT